MSAPRIFLSHTSRLARVPADRSFVQAALDALIAAEMLPRDMRYFTADDQTPAQVCMDAVRSCDVYVGLFGCDYGSPVRDRPDVSYTELEFLTALEEKHKRGLRIFAFLLDEKADEAQDPLDDCQTGFRDRQAAFRQRVQDSGITTDNFATPGDLQYRLYRLIREKLPAASPERRLQHLLYLPANFTGRQAELEESERQIRAAVVEGTSLSFVGFRGMGGIGKTALAAALADRLASDGRLFPAGVLWANVLDRSAEDVAREWVRDLGGDISGLTPEQCLTRFHELAAARRPVVVLDNVPRGSSGDGIASKLMVRARGVATLLTTRFREAVPAGVPIRQVEALQLNEAISLLVTHVGDTVASDRASAEAVLEQCGRLPLFINAAGRAVANGYYSLTEYAAELRRRGLAALADEDEKAAVVFDLSWRFVSEPAQQVLSALAMAPGADVGPNLAAAWLRQSGGEANRGGRLLAELANAALLIPTDEQKRRYRYHDRVRDYAVSKLKKRQQASVRQRLLASYTDWDTVRAEYEAVGAFALAEQYLRLREQHTKEPPDFAPWYHFVRGQASVLGEHPQLFFQQAFNEPVESPVSRAAQERVGTMEESERWLEWLNRASEFVSPACLQILTGHTGLVRSVAVAADGRTAVSGADDETLRLWDLSSGHCRATLTGHTKSISSVALSSDGRTAVSGAWDHTVRVWDLSSGQCRAALTGHTGWVRSVALSADERVVVSGAGDKTVCVWDLSSGQCRDRLIGHTASVESVALSADGRTAVSGGQDGTVRVWDLSSGRCRATLIGHTAFVTSVALSVDGQTAVSGGPFDDAVRVWDLSSGQCRATLTGHTSGVNSVAACPPTAGRQSRGRGTKRCVSGTSPAASGAPPSPGIRARSRAWRCRRTAGRLSRGPPTTRCVCGTSPAASAVSPSPGTPTW